MASSYEGQCNLEAVKGSGAFFNSLQVLQRDLSVLCLSVHLGYDGAEGVSPQKGTTILDAMCGGGIRAVRYALEVPGVSRTVAADLDLQSSETAKRTASLSSASVEIRHGDCNRVMSEMVKTFDVIDLDPCGSPSAFMEKAILSIKSGGLLCIASTEDPSLDPKLCEARYGGKCFNREMSTFVGQGCSGEIYIRLLLAHVMKVAQDAGRRAVPLLSLNLQFFRRVYVRIEDISPQEETQSSSHVLNGQKRQKRTKSSIPLVYIKANPKNKNKGPLWELFSTQDAQNGGGASSTTSPTSPSDIIAGPMYGGYLHNYEFVNRLWVVMKLSRDQPKSDMVSKGGGSMLAQKVRGFGSRVRLESLLRLAHQESKTTHDLILKNNQTNKNQNSNNVMNQLDVVMFCHEPSGRGGGLRSRSEGPLTGDQWRLVIKELKQEGFHASQSHIDSFALKTNAGWSNMLHAVEKVRKLSNLSSCREDNEEEEGSGTSSGLGVFDKLFKSGVMDLVKVQELDTPSHIMQAISSNSNHAMFCDRMELFPDWLKNMKFPTPRGLPHDIVNADEINVKALRASIKSLLLSSDSMNQRQHQSDLWVSSANVLSSDENNEDSAAYLSDFAYRQMGKCRQVIVVGEGAKAAVKKGAGMHLIGIDDMLNLKEFSSGLEVDPRQLDSSLSEDEEEDDDEEEEGTSSMLNSESDSKDSSVLFSHDYDELLPVEGVETLSAALRLLKPYGVIVLRSGRHVPPTVGGEKGNHASANNTSNFPALNCEGALILGDDRWSAVIASNPLNSGVIGGNNGGGGSNNHQKKHKGNGGGGSQRGDSSSGDTLTVTASFVGLCGVVIEAPPPPISGHALCVTGGKASVTLEGCLLRGPTDHLESSSGPNSANSAATSSSNNHHASRNNSQSKTNNQNKKRKNGSSSVGNGTLRGCVCAADGAFLRLVRCLLRGGFGERSRKLVAAAAEAADVKARGFNNSVLGSKTSSSSIMKPVNSKQAEVSDSSSTNTSSTIPAAVTHQSNVIGGKGAGLAIGGAGVFVVGKAVCEMEGGVIDGCKGAGMEARQGGRIYLHSGGGVACISHCGGAGILSQSHGSTTIRGPGVGVIGCLGEASLLVGSNGTLDCSNSVSIHNSRGHGLLAHAGAACSVESTHFDEMKQCGICCRGDGTTLKLGQVLISRSRQANLSSGDRANISINSEAGGPVLCVVQMPPCNGIKDADLSKLAVPLKLVEESSGGKVVSSS